MNKNKKRTLCWLFCAWLLISACHPKTPDFTITSEPLATVDSIQIQLDLINAKSFDKIEQASSLIVIGRATAKEGTIDGPPFTVGEGHPQLKATEILNVYRFQIKDALKGTPPADNNREISITQIEGYRTTGGDDLPIKVATNLSYIPIELNQDYLLFLIPIDETGYDGYFKGPVEPWRFIMASNGCTRADSPLHALFGVWMIDEIKADINGLKQSLATDAKSTAHISKGCEEYAYPGYPMSR